VKGVRRLGVRLGNWLTPDQGRRLLEHAQLATPREARDHAMLAMLIGRGLRGGELLALTLESDQQREEHWVIADLVGTRTSLSRLTKTANFELCIRPHVIISSRGQAGRFRIRSSRQLSSNGT
jgi:site-specific recombinase XerD